MAKCNFSIPFTITAAALVQKAKNAIEGQGGSFSGNTSSGNFSVQLMGTIAGSYEITGQEMTVTITDKPIFIGCGQIEAFMRGQFGK